MNFYNVQHKYYCGIDLHSKNMYVCIMDQAGNTLVHRNIRSNREYFLKVLEPYREDVVVAAECVFAWYWLADLCAEAKIEFVLGHALYMKAIHGGKAKNDRIDSKKICTLLRGGMLPTAYVYPKKMRAARDLMRRRSYFVRKRAELLAHTQSSRLQYNLPDFPSRVRTASAASRVGIEKHFPDPYVSASIEADLVTIEHYSRLIVSLEKQILKAAKEHQPDSLRILDTIPGIGTVLALTILYEINDITRFPKVGNFLSYSRLVKCAKLSDGKYYGTGCKRIGNAHLKWAFSEAAVGLVRSTEEGKKCLQRLEKKHGKGKALSLLASELGRAAYFMLSRKQSFDMNKFLNK